MLGCSWGDLTARSPPLPLHDEISHSISYVNNVQGPLSGVSRFRRGKVKFIVSNGPGLRANRIREARGRWRRKAPLRPFLNDAPVGLDHPRPAAGVQAGDDPAARACRGRVCTRVGGRSDQCGAGRRSRCPASRGRRRGCRARCRPDGSTGSCSREARVPMADAADSSTER